MSWAGYSAVIESLGNTQRNKKDLVLQPAVEVADGKSPKGKPTSPEHATRYEKCKQIHCNSVCGNVNSIQQSWMEESIAGMFEKLKKNTSYPFASRATVTQVFQTS